MSFFYPEQLYPEDDPFAAAQALGLPLGQALQGPGQFGGQQGQFPDYDLNMLAEMLGIQYNPSQGYPNKIVPDQVMDIYGPTPDYLLPQLYNIQNPDAGGFDLDAFFSAAPELRGPLAEAYTQAEGDPIDIYSYLQSNEPQLDEAGEQVAPGFQDRLRQEIGRTEWNQLERQGNLDVLLADTPEEKDEAALDYYMRGLEDVLAAGSPTTQRAEAQLDYTRQREGFRPGPGTGQPYPQFEGPGFGQQAAFGAGGAPEDPLAALASSPAYTGAAESGTGPLDFVRDEPDIDRNRFGRGDDGGFQAVIGGRRFNVSNAPWERMALQRRVRDDFLNRRPTRRNQDANGGGRSNRGSSRGIAERIATGDTPIQRLFRFRNPFG